MGGCGWLGVYIVLSDLVFLVLSRVLSSIVLCFPARRLACDGAARRRSVRAWACSRLSVHWLLVTVYHARPRLVSLTSHNLIHHSHPIIFPFFTSPSISSCLLRSHLVIHPSHACRLVLYPNSPHYCTPLLPLIPPRPRPHRHPPVAVQRSHSTFICCLRSLARFPRTFRGPLSHSFAHRIVSIAHRPSCISSHRSTYPSIVIVIPPTVPLSTCTLALALASNHCRYRRLASARPRPRPRPGQRPRCIPPLPLPTLLPGHNPTGPHEPKLEPTIVDARLAAGDHDHDQE